MKEKNAELCNNFPTRIYNKIWHWFPWSDDWYKSKTIDVVEKNHIFLYLTCNEWYSSDLIEEKYENFYFYSSLLWVKLCENEFHTWITYLFNFFAWRFFAVNEFAEKNILLLWLMHTNNLWSVVSLLFNFVMKKTWSLNIFLLEIFP